MACETRPRLHANRMENVKVAEERMDSRAESLLILYSCITVHSHRLMLCNAVFKVRLCEKFDAVLVDSTSLSQRRTFRVCEQFYRHFDLVMA